MSQALSPISKRIKAEVIDSAFFVSALFLIGLVSTPLPKETSEFVFWLLLCLLYFYCLLSDGMLDGGSIGKKIMGIQVVSVDTGEPCTYLRSFARNVTMLLWIIDIIFVFGSERRRLGDHLAGTKVIILNNQ